MVKMVTVTHFWKVLAVALALACGSAMAQDKVAAAKQEGKLVIYGSLESGIMDEVEKAFTAKYGIPIEYYRAASNKTLDRVMTEARAGKVQSDVVVTNRGPMLLLKKENVFAKYVSPEAKNFPDDVKDPDTCAALVAAQGGRPDAIAA